ncbi:cupin domain-containing protein [Pannonibacter phragmitetus]|uniref:cupin domain-containing protein n=1 Tax=Pannonibacter phragmitetus TaxID=121719 RepID=UPI000A635828|nr:cupin domain-containing protein [Pannonibacter phragmitetus]
MKPVVTLATLPMETQAHGESFEARKAAVAAPLGATRLGARYVEIPPGKKGWPYHCHLANDEMFVILSGSGILRYGEEEFPLAAGDVAVCPAGGTETAHQLIAGPDEALRYLAISSMHDPDIVEYPDSGKMAVYAGAAPGGDARARRLALTFQRPVAAGYWDGED